MDNYPKEDFFVLLRYRNGAFSASLKRDKERTVEWSACNSSELLGVFESVYQFMRSEKQETSIAGINVVKRKTSQGTDCFSMDFGIYHIDVMKTKDVTKDTVIVRGSLPFAPSNQNNTSGYYNEAGDII